MKRRLVNRVCYNCGATDTNHNTRDRQIWYLNHDEADNALCHICMKKYFYSPEYIARRISYKGIRLTMGKPVRTGKCSICGKEGYTNLHHTKYDDSNPLANTIELCVPCHREEEIKLEILRRFFPSRYPKEKINYNRKPKLVEKPVKIGRPRLIIYTE